MEHINVSISRKASRIDKIARKFRDNLKYWVDLTRLRKHHEWLKAQELEELERKKEKPIVLKNVPPEPKNKPKFVCFRTECNLRTFLTADRYEVGFDCVINSI